MRLEYFFAFGCNLKEFNELLISGWRKFGTFFFRPRCETCFECIPIRIMVKDFQISKNQKRVINKNINTKVLFSDLVFKEEIFEIYKDHSLKRFNQKVNKEDFIQSFFYQSVPSILSEFYIEDKLAGVGFIDISSEALSSVYFIYGNQYEKYSLGTFGALKEIEYAKSLGLKYYYLGYYVKDNHRMAYKAKFKSFELYDWKEKEWKSVD